MSISAVSAGSSTFQMGGSSQMTQMKQSFNDLVTALKSGNLDDAKKAFDKLQANAPSQGGDSKNPMSSEIEKLKKALDSGDLKGAQDAVSQIQTKMSKGPPAGAPAGGSPPQGAQTDTVQLNSTKGGDTASTSSSSTVYDKMDANKDGTVSAQERLAYELEHPTDTTSATVLTSDNKQEKSGVQTYA